MKKLALVFGFSLFIFSNHSFSASHYYPSSYDKELDQGSLEGSELKEALFKLMNSSHIVNSGSPDTLVSSCSLKRGTCVSRKILSYKDARKKMFGELHLKKNSNGYYIKDVYCEKKYDSSRFNVGPGKIPNHKNLNCEHTWPQSRFSRKFPKGMQKTDLHHLFPTASFANSARANYEFSELNREGSLGSCPSEVRNGDSFEPPQAHKGNVARALFYFSVRYKKNISRSEERVLKKWHIEDPVDSEEMKRNNKIYKIQNNRNPFIDYPELVSRITNF